MTRWRGVQDAGIAWKRSDPARGAAILFAVLAMVLLAPQGAMAWKPFAHNYTGDQAYADAVDDGRVTVGAHSYPLRADLLSALRQHRTSYNAGVVGPDGFPDLIYGQSQIHPVHTGRWLSYLVQRAWAAQSDRRYDAKQRAQILAFTYGFLTHAAGDMWGHTLINDFAGGVFPSFKEFTNPTKAKIILRHVVVEAYAGSATPGWDRSTEPTVRRCARLPGPRAPTARTSATIRRTASHSTHRAGSSTTRS